jgi:hypothetical protein
LAGINKNFEKKKATLHRLTVKSSLKPFTNKGLE